MGRVFDWLDRKTYEPVREYDIRINSLAAFHAGYAFFSLINYEDDINAFHVYNVWNGEFNSKLVSALPSGGFMLHCDRELAERLSEGNTGYPVFVRLKSKRGRLYVMSFCVTYSDMVMDMYFNGCEVIPPEYVWFFRNEAPDDAHMNESMISREVPALAGSRIPSLFGPRTSYRGSYGSGLFMRGSYRRTGSFRNSLRSSYSFGKGFGAVSGIGGAGSFARGSFLLGYGYGSFLRGSFPARLYNGSYYSGSYHRGSFVYGGGDGVSRYMRGESGDTGLEGRKDVRFVNRRLIEELGYGLDLI
ncbi:MAG: hypothetical protein K5686_11215 [Lachnospiraceae bacterium]|nr:hypothetical protein [Lachnospiraceae bacterium]